MSTFSPESPTLLSSIAAPGAFASDLPGHLRPSGGAAGGGAAQRHAHGQCAGGAFWIIETWAEKGWNGRNGCSSNQP